MDETRRVNIELVKRGLRSGDIVYSSNILAINEIVDSGLFYDIHINKSRKNKSQYIEIIISNKEFRWLPHTTVKWAEFLGYYKYIEKHTRSGIDVYNGRILYKDKYEIFNCAYSIDLIDLDDFERWLVKQVEKFNEGFEDNFSYEIEYINTTNKY